MNLFRHPLLDLAAMEALRAARLRPRGAAEGTFAGPHRSHFRGTAVEFADYREYSPGDDIRLVDWKVYARTDRHYVRLYDAERNLLTYLVVDASGSMAFSGVGRSSPSKWLYASRLAAALAYLVLREGDEAGVSIAADRLREHLPPAGAWPQLGRVLDLLSAGRAEGGTDLATCLEEVFPRIRRRGVLVVLSDFLEVSPAFWRAVDLFRRSRFDVMLFQVLHPEELELPDVTSARFLGSEGEPGHFQAEPAVVRAGYRARIEAHLAEVKGGCQARGCDHQLVRTVDDPYRFLRDCFLARKLTAGGTGR